MDAATALASFQRASLADQAAAALRKAISEGVLVGSLPGEHQLALEIGISRPSLRAALAQLAAEGLITRCNGRRSRLSSSGRSQAKNTPRMIHVVCPESREESITNRHPILLEMRAYFSSKQIGWEEIFDRKLGGPQPERQLQGLVSGREHSCWLLLACPAPVHRWFKRAGVPVFSLGCSHPGIDLPSIDIDYHAVGWHAAGAIVKSGHLHIGLLEPNRLNAGDRNSCEGFYSFVTKHSPHVKITEIRIAADQTDLHGKLDRLIASCQRPTALFSLLPQCTLRAMFHLLQSGLKIPRDISFVSRDTTPLIDIALPETTRYRSSNLNLTHCAERIAQALLTGHHVPPKSHLFIPTFIPGCTLAAPPAMTQPRR